MASSRARPPPPPLRLSKGNRSSTVHADNQLLYDLPSASSLCSPTLEFNHQGDVRLNSPTNLRPQSRISIHPTNRSRTSHALSPSSSSPRGRISPLPGAGSVDDELEAFALKCRAWYFEQDEEAGRHMSKTLAGLPQSLRANYARIQAHIRSSFHAYMAARRKAEFQAHLSSTAPGGSLAPHSRAHPTSSSARRERLERFERFVNTWCNPSMPGTKPFFESLWASMRLQVVPEKLGGAGSKKIEWQFDDAVFMESAGKEFMLEAIDVLKGVLGFEERQASRSSSVRPSDETMLSRQHSRSQSEPLSVQLLAPSNSQKPDSPALRPQLTRSRAPSDPFLDSNTDPSTSPGKTGSRRETKSITGSTGLPSPPTGEEIDALLLRTAGGERKYAPSLASETFDGHAHMRIWTMPNLSNPELIALLSVFPSFPFLTRRALPRFAVVTGRTKPPLSDLEEGVADALDDQNELRIGTGILRVGARERAGEWRGNWWERLKMWLRSLFR